MWQATITGSLSMEQNLDLLKTPELTLDTGRESHRVTEGALRVTSETRHTHSTSYATLTH